MFKHIHDEERNEKYKNITNIKNTNGTSRD